MLGTIDQPAWGGCCPYFRAQAACMLAEAIEKGCRNCMALRWSGVHDCAVLKPAAGLPPVHWNAVQKYGLAPKEKSSGMGMSCLRPVGMQGTPWVAP